MNKNEPWYGVKILLRNTESNVFEEQVLIFKADSFKNAEKNVIKYTKEQYETFENHDLVDVVDVFHIFDKNLINGSEVYSHMSESILNPEEYVQHHYGYSLKKKRSDI